MLVSYRLGDMWAPRLDNTEALQTEALHFIDCIENGREPETDGLAGLRMMNMIEAAETSLRDRGRSSKSVSDRDACLDRSRKLSARSFFPERSRRGLPPLVMKLRSRRVTLRRPYACARGGFTPHVIGKHGGREVSGKAKDLARRAWDLARWARKQRIDLAVSHNSYSQILAAASHESKPPLMDYEHQPANHLRVSTAFASSCHELSRRVCVVTAQACRASAPLSRDEGGCLPGATFNPDPSFAARLCELGVNPDNVLVLMRPPAPSALSSL